MSNLFYLSKEPQANNLRIHPGLRHKSRLHTKVTPYIRPKDPFPDCQLRLAKNTDDMHPQQLIYLNEAKNLFSKQLPNMGASYIARLVFDHQAITVFVLHNGNVTGSITARLFPFEAFAEIVFLAVDSAFQARGYGRLVMNYLKMALQTRKLYDILACADNEAVIFFKKQGFNDKGIFMDPDRWIGRIKDYEGITLVHCVLQSQIDYMNFSEAINKQISMVEDVIGPHFITPPESFSHPFTTFPEGPTFLNIPLPELSKMIKTKMPLSEIDSHRLDYYEDKMEENRLKMIEIIDWLETDERIGPIFTKPVTEQLAPGYFQTIRRPMDLATIRKRLMRFPDYYKRPECLAADINLIAENCKTFNQITVYIQAANILLSRFRQLYNERFPRDQIN